MNEFPAISKSAGVAGVVLLIVAALARALLGGGRRGQRSERAFSELAAATGGTFSVEPRGLDKSGFSGGPTGRWTLLGTAVTLQKSRRSEGTVTRWSADVTTPKPLRFTVLPRNAMTRMLTSPKFVAMLQAGVKQPDGELTEKERAQALNEIGILGGAEVTLGHALLDEKIIVKGNDRDLARHVLTGRGVSERLNELNEAQKSWTLSLVTAQGSDPEAPGAARLSLELPGGESKPEPLRAGLALFEALLASMSQNGVLGSAEDDQRRRAAG